MQQIRARQHHHRERDSRSLATRQRRRSALQLRRPKSEPPEVPVDEPPLPLRTHVADHVEQRLVQRHLRHVLPVIRRGDRAADSQLTGGRLAIAHERLQKRRLSRAVRPDDPQTSPRLHRPSSNRSISVRSPTAIVTCSATTTWSPPRSDASSRSDIVPPSPGGGLSRATSARAASAAPSPASCSGPRCCGGCNPLRSRSPCAACRMRAAARAAAPRAARRTARSRRCTAIARLALEVQHVVHDRREKCAVVADEQHGLASVSSRYSSSHRRRLEIEVVRRLVEQQHVRRRSRAAAPAPLARARRRSACTSGCVRAFTGSKPSPCEHCVDSRRERVAALALETLEIAGVALHLLVVAASPSSPSRWPAPRATAPARAAPRTGLRRFPHRLRTREVAVLIQHAELGRRRLRHRSPRRLQRAGDELEQRRLSRAVPAHDPPPLTLRHGERDVLEQLSSRRTRHGDVG